MDRTVPSILPKLPDVMKRNRIKEDHAHAPDKNKMRRQARENRQHRHRYTQLSQDQRVRGEKWSPVDVPVE